MKGKERLIWWTSNRLAVQIKSPSTTHPSSMTICLTPNGHHSGRCGSRKVWDPRVRIQYQNISIGTTAGLWSARLMKSQEHSWTRPRIWFICVGIAPSVGVQVYPLPCKRRWIKLRGACGKQPRRREDTRWPSCIIHTSLVESAVRRGTIRSSMRRGSLRSTSLDCIRMQRESWSLKDGFNRDLSRQTGLNSWKMRDEGLIIRDLSCSKRFSRRRVLNTTGKLMVFSIRDQRAITISLK